MSKDFLLYSLAILMRMSLKSRFIWGPYLKYADKLLQKEYYLQLDIPPNGLMTENSSPYSIAWTIKDLPGMATLTFPILSPLMRSTQSPLEMSAIHLSTRGILKNTRK